MPRPAEFHLSSRLPDAFVLGLMAMVGLATLLPARGAFSATLSTIVTYAVSLVFFLHGLRLSREAVVAGFSHWRLHGAILGLTFVVYPLLIFVTAQLLPTILPSELWLGMIFIGCLPSTVQSSIAFVAIARGNVAGAVAQAAASNMFGTIFTPLLVGALISLHSGKSDFSGMQKVMLQLLLPFVAGHLLRPLLLATVQPHFSLLSKIDKATILAVVYAAFSVAVVDGIWSRLGLGTLIIVTLACLVLLAAGLLMSEIVGRVGGFDRADHITIRYAGTLKSLAAGLPMAQLLLPAPQVGMILIPLLLFHQLQLIICAWLARRDADAGSNSY